MVKSSKSIFTFGVIFTLASLKPTQGHALFQKWTNYDRSIYRNINPICSHESCAGRVHSVTSSHDAGCQCDEMCSLYEDCCPDSPFFTPSDEALPKRNFTCVHVSTSNGDDIRLKMIKSCPLGSDVEDSSLCEMPDGKSFILGQVPITVKEKMGSVIYSNVYCARCNAGEDSEVSYLWNMTIDCDGHYPSSKSSQDEPKSVFWDPLTKQYRHSENGLSLECHYKPMLPWHHLFADIEHHVRCPDSSFYVDHCPEDWPNSTDVRLCKSYSARVQTKSGGKLYKNQHCLKCHGGGRNDVRCVMKNVTFKVKPALVPADEIVYIPDSAHYPNYPYILDLKRHCQQDEHYDEILKKCKKLLPAMMRYVRGSSPIDTCTRITLSSKHYKLLPDNETVTVPEYHRNFSQGHFRLTNGRLEICEKDIPHQPPTVISLVISMVTVIGLSLSIVFLLLHLFAVVVVAELKNLSGITLASLCVALLGAYSSFIAGLTLEGKSFTLCYTSAVATYVFFMTSFFWTMLLALDVSRVLRASIRKFRYSHGFKWRRFTVYSIIAWGIPIIFGIAAYFVDRAAPGTIDDRFKPNFALGSCWFNTPQSLLVFFLIPLAVIKVLNISCFVYATVIMPRKLNRHRKNLRVYVKLTILLGLSWIVGLLASALDNDVLWLVFSVLNTFQGLFIFLTFTLTSKVKAGLSKFFSSFQKSRKETIPVT